MSCGATAPRKSSLRRCASSLGYAYRTCSSSLPLHTNQNTTHHQEDDDQDAVMTALSFHQQGDVCVVARSDGVISALNCLSGLCVAAPTSALARVHGLVEPVLMNTNGTAPRRRS